MLSDIFATLGIVGLASILAAGVIKFVLLPYGQLPTREQERTTPASEMLVVHRKYLRRSVIIAGAYTAISVALCKIPAVSIVASLSITIAFLAWVILIVVRAELGFMRQRIERGTYGMSSRELREHLRQL